MFSVVPWFSVSMFQSFSVTVLLRFRWFPWFSVSDVSVFQSFSVTVLLCFRNGSVFQSFSVTVLLVFSVVPWFQWFSVSVVRLTSVVRCTNDGSVFNQISKSFRYCGGGSMWGQMFRLWFAMTFSISYRT